MPQTNDAAYDLSTPATFSSEAEATNTNTCFSLIFFRFFRLRRSQVKKAKKINNFLSYHLLAFRGLPQWRTIIKTLETAEPL